LAIGLVEMKTVLITIHLMVVSAMVLAVLLQRSEGGGLGMGSSGGFLSSRGTANVLTRTTAILAAVFFATSLTLSILAGFDRKPHSILDSGGSEAQTPSPPPSPGRGTPEPPKPPEAPGPQVPQSK